MSFFQRPDGEIYYEATGQGPPLALVSGLGGTGGYWASIVPALSRHFTVVLHDHMGTGKSTSRRTHHSVDALAEDIDALMAHLGHARYHLLGHSTGAAVGQVLGADRPQRIDRLVLFAGWAGPDRHFELCFSARKALLERVSVNAYNEATPIFLYPPLWISRNPDALASVIKLYNDTSPAAAVMAARIDMIVAFDRRKTAKSIANPTLIICAKDDILTPPHLSEELASLIPHAQLKLLDYGGHACSQVVADEFTASVLPFLLK